MPETSFRLSRLASEHLAAVAKGPAGLDQAALAPVLALEPSSVATVVGAPGSGKTFALA